jgi:hypothetical protein
MAVDKPFGDPPRAGAKSGMRVKGATLRSYVHWLQRQKKIEAVMARVPPSTLNLIRDPPLPGAWIDGMEVVRIVAALEAVDGIDGVRRCAVDTLQDMMPHHRTLITGLLRLFGASPALMFRRVDDLLRTSVEGIHYVYTATADRAGFMDVQYDVASELPQCVFVNGMSLMMLLFMIAGVAGTVGEPERRGPARVRYALSW